MSSNLQDVQAQSSGNLGSVFQEFAARYGLAQTPRTVPELLYALHPMLSDHQIELLRYLFMDPGEFVQQQNVYPPGQPTSLPQNMLNVLNGQDISGNAYADPTKPPVTGAPAVPPPVDPTAPVTTGTSSPDTLQQAAPVPYVQPEFSGTPFAPPPPGGSLDAAGKPLRAEHPNPTNYNANVVQDPVTKLYYDKTYMTAPIDVAANRAVTKPLGDPGGYSAPKV